MQAGPGSPSEGVEHLAAAGRVDVEDMLAVQGRKPPGCKASAEAGRQDRLESAEAGRKDRLEMEMKRKIQRLKIF